MNRVSIRTLDRRGSIRLSYTQARMLYRATLAVLGENPPRELHLFYTDDAGIRAVNHRQRGIDKTTDVLSFPIGTTDITTGRVFLGDIVISLPRAVEQSREYGHGYDRELCYLAVHGTLHLLGYDHKDAMDQRAMREAEERVMDKLGLGR